MTRADNSNENGVSVVIPTYRREGVLIDTISQLRSLAPPPSEILVVDQTEKHEPETAAALTRFHDEGSIRWVRLQTPSITAAMNEGLCQATQPTVLFLDDDIRSEPDLIGAHARAQRQHPGSLVAGRVIQPWEEDMDPVDDGAFRFSGTSPGWIEEFMGGNFSVGREEALAVGGFDQNFVRVAYRFEAEFAHRFRSSGRRIFFEPAACIHHLKVSAGGTRTFGDHLTTWKPDHAVGAYYFATRTLGAAGILATVFKRPFLAIATRHHLRRPWWIPVTLLSELFGMAWAFRLSLAGPRYAPTGPACD